MHTMHSDLSGEKCRQLKWKALIKKKFPVWWILVRRNTDRCPLTVQVSSQRSSLNFPGFEIEILSELTLALMTGDHWGLTLLTGGVQLNSIVRSHSHKPHWRVIRDLYIINFSQSVCPAIRTLHIPPGEAVNNHGLEVRLHNFDQGKIFKFSFLSEGRRGRTIRFLRFPLFSSG